MQRREFMTGAMALSLMGCQVGSGAHREADRAPAPPTPEEHEATIAALRAPKRSRPLVVIVADAEGAETTDLIVPFGVLKRSGLCDVRIAAAAKGRTQLHPALAIEVETSFDEIAAEAPEGPDYVIVPALHDRAAPAPVSFIRAAAGQGAIVAGICSGALTLEAAGLMRGRRATTHWWDVEAMERRNPGMTWVRDRRYVVDRKVATTTGVSASLPFSLALVEAMGGPARAQSLAAELGVASWDARHESEAFDRRGDVIIGDIVGTLTFWRHERIGVRISEGVDEIALAFTADAWSRTNRSEAIALAESDSPVEGLAGLKLYGERAAEGEGPHLVIDALPATPGAALAEALRAIRARYGEQTASVVALQLEQPWEA